MSEHIVCHGNKSVIIPAGSDSEKTAVGLNSSKKTCWDNMWQLNGNHYNA